MPFTPWSGSSSGTAAPSPWQFAPETYGAKGDATMLYDITATNGSPVITTSGLPAPAAPTLNSGAGTVGAGTYLIQVTYVTPNGETLASTASSITVGASSSITVTSPLPWTSAIAYYVYCTQAGGGAGTETRQQAAGSPTPLRTNYVISAPPSSTGSLAPVSNTSASAPFKSTDVGKSIIVTSAGGFVNVPLVTTIASYQSASQVTLAANATRSVAGQGGVYGTDDTAAVQAAINAAVAYAQTAGVEPDADVDVVLNSVYCIAGTPGGANMSAQLQLPYVNPYVGPKVNLRFVTPQPAPGPVHWEQPNPPMPRGTLVSVFYDDLASGFGPPPNVVIGAPVTGFGGNGGKFSNMRVSGDLNFLTSYRPCIAGLDLYGCAQADMKSIGYFCMAMTATAAGGWPPYQAGTGNASAWQVFAYRTPTTGNNALNKVGVITGYGAYHVVVYTDHFTADQVNSVYNFFGATAAPSSSPAHHCSIQSMVCEASGYALYWDNSGTYSGGGSQAITVDSLQCESLTDIINDPGNYAQGEVHAEQQGTTGQVAIGKLSGGGANIRLIWSNQALGHVSSPPAVPASTTALTNTFYQPVTVTIHTGAGVTVSAIALDGTATGQTMAASSSLTVPVRNGGTITLTYAGGTPTWDWWIG